MHAWRLDVCEDLDVPKSMHGGIGRACRGLTPKADAPNAGAAAEAAPNAGVDATPKAGCEGGGMPWYQGGGYEMVL